jgi:hypothetical protein
MSTLERMTSEPHPGSPAWFELDRSGAQSEVSGKIRVSGFSNRIIQFWQIQPSSVVRAGNEDRVNLHPSGVWAREGEDHG